MANDNATPATVEPTKAELAQQVAALQARIDEMHAKDNLAEVMFSPLPPKTNPKAPRFQYRVLLASGPLKGVQIVGAVMGSKEGGFAPTIPQVYGTDAVQPALIVETFNGKQFSRRDEDGENVINNWTPALLTAFNAYLLDTKKQKHVITFRS